MDDTGFDVFRCNYDQCNKVYQSYYSLKRHIKGFHLRIKPHECTVCGKAFIASSLLKEHILVHTGEKPLQCQVCGKRFRHASQISFHKKIHRTQHTSDILAVGLNLSSLLPRFGELPKMALNPNPENVRIELPPIRNLLINDVKEEEDEYSYLNN